MKRNSLEKMIFWMKAGSQKPLYLTGAPEVGKTYMALDFAKMFYDGFFYINLHNDALIRSRLNAYFASNPDNISDFLSDIFHIPAEWLNKFLYIFDEINFDIFIKDKFANILKNRNEKDAHLSVCFISSLEPDKEYASLCEILRLYPMEFDEFLSAKGAEWYTEVIRGHFQNGKKVPSIVHKELLNLFQDYLKTGGMPSVVHEFITTGNLDNIPVIQNKINLLFKARLNEMPSELVTRAEQLLESYPEQLLKDNKKFQYTKIRKGTTHAMYSDSLNLISDMHLVNKLDRGEIEPLEDNRITYHPNQFRLYSADFGLLNAIITSRLPIEQLYDEVFDDEINPLGQLLLENYFLCHEKDREKEIFFWESGSVSGMDFVRKTEEGIIPIEIRYLENNRSKSLSVFKSKIKVPYSIKISSSNFDTSGNVKNYPYYSIFCL